MSVPTFVDLVEPGAAPPPAYSRLTAEELHMDPAAYRRHVDIEDKIEAGTATIEERCEAALRTFCYANVADMRLVDQGEVYSDGKHHYFRSADLVEHLFQEVPQIIDNWTVRYEQAMLRKLNCHAVKLEVAGSRGRAKAMHVYRTPWRGGMQGLTVGSPAGVGHYWSFDPDAPWNAGMSDHDILSLERARTVHKSMWLTEDQMADARANPQGIPVALERPKDAAPIKALPVPRAEDFENMPDDVDLPTPRLTKDELAAWKQRREDASARMALKQMTADLTPEEEARVAMPVSDDDMAAFKIRAKSDAEIRAEDRAEGIAPRRKTRTPAMERNRVKGLRRHFAVRAEEDAGKRLDPDFDIPT